MKLLSFTAVLALLFSACQSNSTNQSTASIMGGSTVNEVKSFYDFKVTTLSGDEYDFSSLKGKRVLIVNTASECGFTGQYEGLQELYEKYGGENFTIIGFPSNDFGKQEPGTNEEIGEFCKKNYGVTFPMMAKTPVTGDEKHPVYAWLTDKDQNGVKSTSVKWNFYKFLVDENGHWVDSFSSMTKPTDNKIVSFAKGEEI